MPGVPRWASALAGGMRCLGGQWHSAAAGGSLPMAPAKHRPGPPLQKYLPVGWRGMFAVTGAASAMEQPGKVQHGPASLLEREVRKSMAHTGKLAKATQAKLPGGKQRNCPGKKPCEGLPHGCDTVLWLFPGYRSSIAGP